MPVTLPVEAQALADTLKVSLTGSGNRELLEQAIADATADVEAYLGRSVLPQTYVETGRWDTGRGWNLNPSDPPVREVVSAVAELWGDPPLATGYFTVTYLAGLDCRDPDKAPIRRYIKAAAMNAPEVIRLWESATGQRGPITNVSAEGQSVSYGATNFGGGGQAGTMAPGALPSLRSLDRWRLAGRRVFVRKGNDDIWPYGGPLWVDPWAL